MASQDEIATLSHSLRKKRGVIRSSITRLGTKLKELEDSSHLPTTTGQAEQIAAKLHKLDAEFKDLHLQIVDVTEAEDDLEREQDILDEHDDRISDFQLRVSEVCTASSTRTPVDAPEKVIISRRLSRLEKNLTAAHTTISSLPDSHDDTSLFEQYREQMSEYKTELAQLYEEMLINSFPEDDALFQLHLILEDTLFKCSHLIRKYFNSAEVTTTTSTPVVGSTGAKLPKLDVPTFNGDILNWKPFWEQFDISIHSRTALSNAEKLVYLQNALKDGPAKASIEGLSRSGEYYLEAIKCLRSRYDRPRLIHQAHVKHILDAPSLKEGNGKELRRLHDRVQQHLRALKSLGHEPSAAFITSVLELKLDTTTMFEWQRHSQDDSDVPHYEKLMDFIDRRAQASEVYSQPYKKNDSLPLNKKYLPKQVPSFPTTATNSSSNCVLCKLEKHPLYICPKFKEMSHDDKKGVLKVNNLCMNCLSPGHQMKHCKSIHRCKRCQKTHHTLLHFDNITTPVSDKVSTNTAIKLKTNCLLMTCCCVLSSPSGLSINARCLLDNASSACFISERVAQSLCLPRQFQSICVSGITGLSKDTPNRHISNLIVSPISDPYKGINITAIVVPRVTCDLPTQPVFFDDKWKHLSDLNLSDPNFGIPSQVDALLGVDIFIESLLPGRRSGPPGSPIAFETTFGWVLAGSIEMIALKPSVTSYHVSISSVDDILLKFWEIEEAPNSDATLSLEERTVLRHFQMTHSRSPEGRFIVTLPKKPNAKSIGESRSQAVRRFLSMERSLIGKGIFDEVDSIMKEYLSLNHAEPVPYESIDKPQGQVFYLPIHVVYKESSTTTKIRPVFDASAKSETGISLNDTLLVGPTVHPTLVDVLLRFRLHRIALTTDVTKMYRAIQLTDIDKDLHRYVWRSNPKETLSDYRMTRVTFGVSASSFAANMSLKQNAIDWAHKYPLAAKAVEQSFYVDDGLTGADTVHEAISLHHELQQLFSCGDFHLRKWNSSDSTVLQSISPELRDVQETHPIIDVSSSYTKTLGLEWNPKLDHFRFTFTHPLTTKSITKRTLVSDVAKVFDVMGWFSPTIIKAKILLQRLWEAKLDWDDLVPSCILDTWMRWKSELPLLAEIYIQRYYFTESERLISLQLHGFSDASEDAYAAVVYLRCVDVNNHIHVSIVLSKSRVAPIKRLTIPRLELCGAQLLTQLLHHTRGIFNLSLQDVHAWTDSTIVLNWLKDSPRRFKTYVGNRVSSIVNRIPPERWKHVNGSENPADAPSRGLFPSELVGYKLWWSGPDWLQRLEEEWPNTEIDERNVDIEANELKVMSYQADVHMLTPVIPVNQYSDFKMLIRVTGWILRFVHNCKAKIQAGISVDLSYLSVKEFTLAEEYWISLSQQQHFLEEIVSLKSQQALSKNSCLLSLRPILDQHNILRVGGRISNAKLLFSQRHPIILHGKDSLTRLIIRSEHLRLNHAGPTLLIASISNQYHIICLRRVVRSITRQCITCKRQSIKPESQLMGQLPLERVTPDSVFENVGVDYAGPIQIKYGYVRKPTLVKAYVCVFVSLSVKAVHLELVSDLTTEAFLACLRRFISRRGHPKLIWSDHGTNFVGADNELKRLLIFLEQEKTQRQISQFCTSRKIEWKFIPQHSPHFGGLWEAAVKSMKRSLKKVIGNVTLTFEEFCTVLAEIEACLNSRPLAPLISNDDGIEVLTPGHFLIGRPLMTLPQQTQTKKLSLLKRWELCQTLVVHFWKRWSAEYLISLNRFNKWHSPSRNINIGDIVLLKEDNTIPSQWPLARIINTHPGNDGLVRVVTLKTSKGTYKRPITKLVVLLPID